MITILKPDEIFVFGSNTAGKHYSGAARQAADEFGAEYGVGEGLTGRCYAFPTLDHRFQQIEIEALAASRELLYGCCLANPAKTFLLTKVGCGIAGYPESTMRALFDNAPENLELPEDWK